MKHPGTTLSEHVQCGSTQMAGIQMSSISAKTSLSKSTLRCSSQAMSSCPALVWREMTGCVFSCLTTVIRNGDDGRVQLVLLEVQFKSLVISCPKAGLSLEPV